ncbi:KDO2-lipid IV(A) lauroyltransferase [Pararhizobium capsulatum DSM 1112]|uniref:KDO2-lipid IV(A) lauroyltransferase n=1 Tax=Pararhizobium capsulatum DSM 1112 TaxID=1121113 RepID=A0ABU0BK26_9HYPH|nr:lipid A biosynthesis lauroyl acyltransferase [Pararhizobium capsulatum]MDQ0318084.1 KDO2-lipid IV(A) lauroyltransferase [Pararhizobium capsulatum DSM 1112]
MAPEKQNVVAKKRQAWVYEAPPAPPVSDFFRDTERRQAAFKYHVKDNIQNAAEFATHFGLKLLPIDLCSAIGAWLGAFVMPRWHKGALRKADRNLKQLLPNASDEERAAILKRNMKNQGRLMTEFSIIGRLSKPSKRVVWNNVDWIVEAKRKGPVIMVGLHLGNWEILGPKLVELGFEPSANYTPPTGRARAWIADRLRIKLGYRLMPPGKDGIRPALKILKGGGVISIFCDEGFGGKIRGPFLGRPPHLEGNIAIVTRLARMTNATICPGYILRTNGANFEATALPPIVLPPEETPGDRLIEDVVLLNAAIEPVIRAHLDQWYFLDNSL